MNKVIREGAVRVGGDLAKHVIQIHSVDGAGRVLTTKPLARAKFIEWCVRLPPGCMVAMEASSSAHHWARKLAALALDSRIISAQLVEPYRNQGASGKNDANDAAAICEAASRPTMRFIPVKSIEQSSLESGSRRPHTHSMTRSARFSRSEGTASPSSRAVLRLMTSSRLATTSIGVSAGLAPFRIRST